MVFDFLKKLYGVVGNLYEGWKRERVLFGGHIDDQSDLEREMNEWGVPSSEFLAAESARFAEERRKWELRYGRAAGVGALNLDTMEIVCASRESYFNYLKLVEGLKKERRK